MFLDSDRHDLLQEFMTSGGTDSIYAIESHVASISQGPHDYNVAMTMTKYDTMALALSKWIANTENDS